MIVKYRNTIAKIVSYLKLNSTPLKSAISRYEKWVIFQNLYLYKSLLNCAYEIKTKDIVYIGSEDKLPLILWNSYKYKSSIFCSIKILLTTSCPSAILFTIVFIPINSIYSCIFLSIFY